MNENLNLYIDLYQLYTYIEKYKKIFKLQKSWNITIFIIFLKVISL